VFIPIVKKQDAVYELGVHNSSNQQRSGYCPNSGTAQYPIPV